MVLPDHLQPGLDVVFCGTAAAKRSALRRHYYAGPGNEFWLLLHQAGFTERLLRPDDDATVLDLRVGLTDLAKGIAANNDRGLRSHYDVAAFLDKMDRIAPRWIAFHGKEAGKAVSRALSYGRDVSLGEQPWRLNESRVFVTPSASGANRDPSRLEGKATRLEWFEELHRLVRETDQPL